VQKLKVGIIGLGSWGQAMTHYFNSLVHEVTAWKRKNIESQSINNITTIKDLPSLVASSELLFISIPVNELRGLYDSIITMPTSAKAIVWGSKGMEANTGYLPHMIFNEFFFDKPIAGVSFSGPTFAEEILKDLPGAICIASNSLEATNLLSTITATGNLRTYPTQDIMGVELGGAIKNIYAICCGIIDGSLLGDNAQAALITRGLHEMTKLGQAMGAQPETFYGLSGLGDMVLTCTGGASRNRNFGKKLAGTRDIKVALNDIGQTVEGYYSTKAIYEKSVELNIDMPIVHELYHILYKGRAIKDAINNLVLRPSKKEIA
jgi:glycerol-3-phosphate dehydrogenase (NAD(P)+)